MGKHLYDESQDKQAGCMWGIVHVLDYHNWQSNVRKMIPPRKYQGRSHHQYEWSPSTSVDGCDGYEKLLQEQEDGAKRSRAARKRSLRARLKAIIGEGTSSMEDKDGFSTKSRSLQRTYSIHHLESVDGFFGKIRKDWNHPIIFLPRNSEDNNPSQSSDISRGECNNSHSPKDNKPDIFEIFKVDKEMLLKHLHDSDEGFANFSRSAFGLNTKGKFSKSRSFPVADLAERRKLKPLKLESKQREVWITSLSVEANRIGDKSQPSQSLDCREGDNAVDRIDEKHDEDGVRKHTHQRSSSLSESMDRYARLFENSSVKDVKLSSSKSLKLSSENGYAPLHFKRIRSLSNADSYFSNINFEVLGEEEEVTSQATIVKENYEIREDDARNLRLYTSNDRFLKDGSLENRAERQLKESDLLCNKDANCLDITLKGIQDQGFISDSDIFLNDTESPPADEEHESRIHEVDCGKTLSSSSENIENYEIKEEMKYPHKKNSDLDYVRYLLDRSGIAIESSEMAWHTSEQLFSPQLFEEVEGGWSHEEDELDGWPDFRGCWHHQMLFGAVNEALLDVYDVSLPYYPKPLSSSCHVRPFPVGDRVVEEVCTSIGTLMSVEQEEEQLLDCIVGRDMARDRSWMNLQMESEAIALGLEDMIFNELLHEVVFS